MRDALNKIFFLCLRFFFISSSVIKSFLIPIFSHQVERKIQISRIRMLIGLYFPSLSLSHTHSSLNSNSSIMQKCGSCELHEKNEESFVCTHYMRIENYFFVRSCCHIVIIISPFFSLFLYITKRSF